MTDSKLLSGLGLNVDKPGCMTIVHPITGAPLVDAAGVAATIDVYSTDSEIYRRYNREAARKRLSSRNPRGMMTPEEIEAGAVDVLVALTAGWRLLALDGTPIEVPFSPETAREIYSAPQFRWLRDQVDAFAVDRANFSKASSPSS